MTIAYVRACLPASLTAHSSFCIPFSVLPPAPLRTHMLTHGIIWHAFVYHPCTRSACTLVSRFISWATFVLSLDDQLSSVHVSPLKNFYYLFFYHRSLSLLLFSFSAFFITIIPVVVLHYSSTFFRVLVVCSLSRALFHVYPFFRLHLCIYWPYHVNIKAHFLSIYEQHSC